MTKFLTLAAAAALAVAAHSAPAQATSRSTFIDGHQAQLYDNSWDIPAIPTPGIAPIVPPGASLERLYLSMADGLRLSDPLPGPPVRR